MRRSLMELAHWLDVLRRRARLFAVVVAVTLVTGLLLAILSDPSYETTADVRVEQPEGAVLLGSSAAEIDLESELRIAESAEVTDAAGEVDGADGVTVVADPTAMVLRFTGRGSTPFAAAEVANAHAEAYVAQRAQRLEERTRSSIARLEEQVAEIDEEMADVTGSDQTSVDRLSALRTRRDRYRGAADQLEVALIVGGTSSARVVSPAEEPDESSPLATGATYLGLALFAGLFVAGGVVGVVEAADRTVKDPSGARAAARGAPVLGRVRRPESAPEIGSVATGVVLLDDPGSATATEFRRLRSTVRTLVDPSRPLVQVTSAGADDGAAHVAVNLATAFAEAGMPTVLVCLEQPAGVVLDVEEPSVGEPLAALVTADSPGATPEAYLARVAGAEELAVVVRPDDARGDTDVHGSIAHALKQLDVVAEAVVVLAPPVLSSATALEVAELVDGNVLVVRERVTPAASVEEAARALELVASPLLGVVLV